MSLSPGEGDCHSPETKHESSGLLDYVCLFVVYLTVHFSDKRIALNEGMIS
jgi:hypothetical protein